MAIITRVAKGSALTFGELDNNFTELQGLITSLETNLKDGVSSDGDTLNKLRGLISTVQGAVTAHGGQITAIQELLESNDLDLDTVQELVDYIKNNKDLIDGVLTNKLDKSSKATEAEANAEGEDTKFITSLRLGTWLGSFLNRALTFTNKTISGANNTLSNIPQSAVNGLEEIVEIVESISNTERVSLTQTDPTIYIPFKGESVSLDSCTPIADADAVTSYQLYKVTGGVLIGQAVRTVLSDINTDLAALTTTEKNNGYGVYIEFSFTPGTERGGAIIQLSVS